MELKRHQIPMADRPLFLGTSFKRVQPLCELENVFIFSSRVERLRVEDVAEVLDLYKAFRNRFGMTTARTVTPRLTGPDLVDLLHHNRAQAYGIKNQQGQLLAAVVIQWLQLPRELNEMYFGMNFQRFAHAKGFCCLPGEEDTSCELLAHVILRLKTLGIKACTAHVLPQHRPFCEKFLPQKYFKRVTGGNFLDETSDTVMILELLTRK